MDRHDSRSGGTLDRWVAAAIGAVFIAVALFILVSSLDAPDLGALLAVVVIGGLGLEAVISAVRNRRCLLSRIGPLP
jgi:hypothetical protein